MSVMLSPSPIEHGLLLTGGTRFRYEPATVREDTNRLLCPIRLGGMETEGTIDTGGIYMICPPWIAQMLDTDIKASLEEKVPLIRGRGIEGGLYRRDITFLAEPRLGKSLTIESTIFVPSPDMCEEWGLLPQLPLIGLQGCLERTTFAVDFQTETFYFGPML